MSKTKCLKLLTFSLLLFGIGSIIIGIIMPILIQQEIDKSINGLWMQNDGYDSWGEVPGKLGLKVVRSFTLYNVTNTKEILQGEVPKVVELPIFPTQEYTKWLDWEYVNKNLTGFGKVISI